MGHRGKALGQPVWKLLGGSEPARATPYASLLPAGHTVDEHRQSLVDKALNAQDLGFRAAKLEVCINGPYSHNGLQEDDQLVVEIVAACRHAVGPDLTLMVDVAYAWPNADHALGVLRAARPA